MVSIAASRFGWGRRHWMWLSSLLVFTLAMWHPALVSAQAQFTMKLGHATANDGQDEIAKFFAKEVERLSGGRIKAPVYNASQLGNNEKMNKDLRSGAQEAIIQPAGFAVPYIPLLGVLDLPFLFPSDEVQTRVLNSEAAEPFRKAARQAGLEIAMWYAGGFKYLATKFPVNKAEDLKGRKIRVIQSPELVGQFKAFGAIGIPLPLAECYTALQQGTVEGIEVPIDVLERFKFHEVAKYVTSMRHGTLSSMIMVNARWLDSLPADLKEAVRKAGEAAAKESLTIMKKHQQRSMDVVKKAATFSELPETERTKLKTASEQVWAEIKKDQAKGEALARLVKAIETAK